MVLTYGIDLWLRKSKVKKIILQDKKPQDPWWILVVGLLLG
jgi:hypothetical protein